MIDLVDGQSKSQNPCAPYRPERRGYINKASSFGEVNIYLGALTLALLSCHFLHFITNNDTRTADM